MYSRRPFSHFSPEPSPDTESRGADPGVLARVWAIRILFRWLRHGEFPDANLDRMGVPPELRGFTMDLVYGTVRWHGLLDAALGLLVERRPSSEAEAALLLGLFQILKRPDIPTFATIHATVEAAKIVGNRRTPVGLINATLRNADRFRRDLDEELAKAPPHVRLSHPRELLARWTAAWGADRAAAICEWDNAPADVVLLALPGGPTASELLARFQAESIEAEPLPDFPETALRLAHGHRVEELPGFREGDFAIQDPSTLAAVELLDVRPGQRILDACAAPGGKAARIARILCGGCSSFSAQGSARSTPLGGCAATPLSEGGETRGTPPSERGDAPKGQGGVFRAAETPAKAVSFCGAAKSTLVALDLHEDRLGGLENTLRRLVPGMDAFVHVMAADAATADADALGGPFDRILLDVPCGNSGVLRRRVDARWRQDPERLARVRASQRRILDNTPRLLAPGGRIVYSTCSIDPSENQEQIDSFLSRTPGFCCRESRLNLPGDHGADGAFAAALERTEGPRP